MVTKSTRGRNILEKIQHTRDEITSCKLRTHRIRHVGEQHPHNSIARHSLNLRDQKPCTKSWRSCSCSLSLSCCLALSQGNKQKKGNRFFFPQRNMLKEYMSLVWLSKVLFTTGECTQRIVPQKVFSIDFVPHRNMLKVFFSSYGLSKFFSPTKMHS